MRDAKRAALCAALAEPGCVFCDRITAGEFDYFDRYSVAFQPLKPVTPGHFLVAPRRHAENALDAPNNAGRALAFAAKMAVEMGLDACNFITSAGVAASQTVPHLHVHVVPRHDGDGLALPWTVTKAAATEKERIAKVAEDLGAHYHDGDGGRSASFAGFLRGAKS